MSRDASTYVALSGGVGGAKLSLGLATLLGERLSIVVNTGDDFEHLGLHISPDVDTALYTLAGLVNEETGWGRREETWTFMDALAKLGGPTWFKLGDGDLATHVDRTARLAAGETLTGICAHLAARLGVAARVLPMTEGRVRTVVDTDQGTLAFQDYFVREQCRPVVRDIRYDAAAAAAADAAGARGPGGADAGRGYHLPVEPVAQRRADPGAAGHAPGHARARRAGGRRLPHHRRQGREGPGGQDHGRAGARARQPQHRLAL